MASNAFLLHTYSKVLVNSQESWFGATGNEILVQKKKESWFGNVV